MYQALKQTKAKPLSSLSAASIASPVYNTETINYSSARGLGVFFFARIKWEKHLKHSKFLLSIRVQMRNTRENINCI